MDEESVVKFEQLYKHALVSLLRYHNTLVNLLDAVMQRKKKDQYLVSNTLAYITKIRGTILDIQTIQQKKLQLMSTDEPLKNMVSLRINFQSKIPIIIVEEDSPPPPWVRDL